MNYSQVIFDCWAYGISYLPLCGLPTWASAFLPSLGGGEVISMGSRRFRVLQKLGEGGYAVVYLVSEIATVEHPDPDPEPRALKRMLILSPEHVDAVMQEISIHSAVQLHPNILPLLDYCCSDVEGRSGGGNASTDARKSSSTVPPIPLVPLRSPLSYGSAPGVMPPDQLPMSASAVSSTVSHTSPGAFLPVSTSAGHSGPTGGGRVACFIFPAYREGTLAGELERLVAAGQRLPSAEVLFVFGQLARAVAHIHSLGYAHRDIKPLNVLIASNPDFLPTKRPQQQQPRGQPQGAPGWAALTEPAQRGAAGDLEAAVPLTAGNVSGVGSRYRCVVMDFGSARTRELQVTSRSQALQVQEDAEAHCSGPYRAPELFDVPSPAPLDFAAADVWSLGATLFHVMYGEPPFQRAMNAAGGSLALAVINCAIGWPRPSEHSYPDPLHNLVLAAMKQEPADRPTAEQLADMAADMAIRGMPDPALK